MTTGTSSAQPESPDEHRAVDEREPLRQGDVLESTDSEATMWTRYLLVITADCDFAHSKHQGRVTCVPLLPRDSYLIEMHLRRILEKFISKMIGILMPLAADAGWPNITRERMREWVLEAERQQIVSDLGLAGQPAFRASGAIDAIKAVSAEISTLRDAVTSYVSASASAPDAGKVENIRKAAVDSLTQPFSSPPGDALFLSSIAPGLHNGYFAYLRHLEQVHEADIATTSAHVEARYRRLATLRPTYVHALTQRFAQVFMSIGLSDTYEEMRDLHAAALREDLS